MCGCNEGDTATGHIPVCPAAGAVGRVAAPAELHRSLSVTDSRQIIVKQLDISVSEASAGEDATHGPRRDRRGSSAATLASIVVISLLQSPERTCRTFLLDVRT